MNKLRSCPVSISKKVCLLGDFAVGKTSLMRRFVYNRFDDKYISTIGVKVSRKTVAVQFQGDTIKLNLMLWDLSGGDQFNNVRNSYLRGANGALLICDCVRPETLERIHSYAEELRAMNQDIALVMAANKSDLIDTARSEGRPVIDNEKLLATAQGLNTPFYLTSAKSNTEVESVFRDLGQQLVHADKGR